MIGKNGRDVSRRMWQSSLEYATKTKTRLKIIEMLSKILDKQIYDKETNFGNFTNGFSKKFSIFFAKKKID